MLETYTETIYGDKIIRCLCWTSLLSSISIPVMVKVFDNSCPMQELFAYSCVCSVGRNYRLTDLLLPLQVAGPRRMCYEQKRRRRGPCTWPRPCQSNDNTYCIKLDWRRCGQNNTCTKLCSYVDCRKFSVLTDTQPTCNARFLYASYSTNLSSDNWYHVIKISLWRQTLESYYIVQMLYYVVVVVGRNFCLA